MALTERHPHLTFAFDPRMSRLLVIAPHVVGHRTPRPGEGKHLATLDAALSSFRELRAGTSGRLKLRPARVHTADPLFAPSRTWQALTPYRVTRHARNAGAAEALAIDLRAECRRRGLPVPHVTVQRCQGIAGVGLVGDARLDFEVAVPGPISLGRNRHLGGGLFICAGAAH